MSRAPLQADSVGENAASMALGRGVLAWALGLMAITLIVFAQIRSFDFIALDDADYVTLNPMVNGGFSWQGLGAAFGGYHASNWHPLTWLAHMLDCQLFGLDSGKHHLMSAAWHALNAGLCFLVFVRLSGKLGPSLLLAGLFALHPQRAESVAWVSERKDLVAGCFFFLTLLAQLAYVRRPRPLQRGLVVLAFACALLSKPSVIMLPLVMILMDMLPFGESLARRQAERGLRFQLLEKAPLLLLAGASALVTLMVQTSGGAVSQEEALDGLTRLSNALCAYGAYVLAAVAPFELAYFYPHPALVDAQWSPWNSGALLWLLLFSAFGALCWRRRRVWPAAALAYAWFLLILLPMIGLVQVGEQAHADRYSYLSSIGLYMLLCFAFPWRRLPAALQWGLGAALLLAAALGTGRELGHWKDSMSLFTRATEVTQNNYAAFIGLANLHNNSGALDLAEPLYQAGLALRPKHPQALYSYGLLKQKQERASDALALYQRSLELQPEDSATHYNIGTLHAAAGKLSEAIDSFARVVALEPKGSPARRKAAGNLASMGRDFQARLKTHPNDLATHKLLKAVEAALQPSG